MGCGLCSLNNQYGWHSIGSYRHKILIGAVVDNQSGNFNKLDIMDKYVCVLCGYVYDPAEGDPEGGVPPGTAFEDLPEGWVCPACGVGVEHFEKEK